MRSVRSLKYFILLGCCGLTGVSNALAEGDTLIYGYVNGYVEKVDDTPAIGDDGKTTWENQPHEFDVPNINMMVQSSYDQQWKMFLNLTAPGASGVSVSTAWVEGPIYQQFLKLRFGKIYRRFGLYNEILDAVPTYIGIEPPELFDNDHLLLTRTTNLMLHGSARMGIVGVQYSLTTGNDEKEGNQIPLGADLRFTVGSGVTFGTSYYNTMGWATPTKKPGEGSPNGGVLNWMEKDKYSIVGGYVEYIDHGLTLQLESWVASHEGVRDPEKVVTVATEAGINDRQAEQFGVDRNNPQAATVKTEAKYDVSTTYVRVGYSFDVMEIELTPYAQYDIYENPETIQNKDYGGDNEAGLADDGKFAKATLGLVVRPNDAVAVKVDGSTHYQKFNGEDTSYSEVRASFSYFWEL